MSAVEWPEITGEAKFPIIKVAPNGCLELGADVSVDEACQALWQEIVRCWHIRLHQLEQIAKVAEIVVDDASEKNLAELRGLLEKLSATSAA